MLPAQEPALLVALIPDQTNYIKYFYHAGQTVSRSVPEWKKILFAFHVSLLAENIPRCKEIISETIHFENHEISECKARAFLHLGKLCIKDGPNSSTELLETAKDSFEKSRSLFISLNIVCGKNECAVEIIKVKICQRNFKTALDDLDELEKLLEKSDNYDGIKRHLIQVFIEKGLIYSMTSDPKLLKKNKSQSLLKSALYYSRRLEDQLMISFSLQATAASILASCKTMDSLNQSKTLLEEAIANSQFGGSATMRMNQYKLLAHTLSELAMLTEDQAMMVIIITLLTSI